MGHTYLGRIFDGKVAAWPAVQAINERVSPMKIRESLLAESTVLPDFWKR